MFEKVAAAVDGHREAMWAFLEHIVNMDSPTENKELVDRVGDVLEAKARELGLHVERDRHPTFGDNLVARWTPSRVPPDVPRVLMIGHFDTVYPAGTAAVRPFRIEGSRAYGPGVLDMKGGLTIGLFALRALLDVYGEPVLPLTVIFNSDEEPGSPYSREVIFREAARHDLALILEPGRPGPAVTVARKGVGIFRLKVYGVEAHAGSEPEKGANSIVEMAAKVQSLAALTDMEVGTTVTPGVISGGTKPYVVPGECELSVDIRVPTVAEQQRITDALAAIQAHVGVPGTRTELHGGFHRPPMVPTEETMKYVALLQRVGNRVGYPLGTASTGGASDGNLTASVGVPTIDGLGAHGGRAHSPDEYVEVDSVEHKCRVLASFLAALADPDVRRAVD